MTTTTTTTTLIEAMKTEMAAREVLRSVDWSGVIDLLGYRGYHLTTEQDCVIRAMADVHTGTILAARCVLAEVGDRGGRSNPTLAAVTRELVGLLGQALSLVDAESRV